MTEHTHTHTIIIIIIAFLCYKVILRTISGNKHIFNKAWGSSACLREMAP